MHWMHKCTPQRLIFSRFKEHFKFRQCGRKQPQCGTHKVYLIYTNRAPGQPRCSGVCIKRLLELMHLCAPNISWLCKFSRGIINSNLRFAAGVARRRHQEKVHYAAHLPGLRLWCRCSACTAAIFSLSLLETCLSLLLLVCARYSLRLALGARQYNQNQGLCVYIARVRLIPRKVALLVGWSAACWHALGKV